MSYDETQKRISLEADASIGVYTGVPGMPGSLNPNGGKQYYFVDITGTHQAGLVGVAGAQAVGVLQNKPQAVGGSSSVAIDGVSLVVAGGTVAAGDKVSADLNSAAITTTTTNVVLGRCIIGASAGQLAVILLQMN